MLVVADGGSCRGALGDGASAWPRVLGDGGSLDPIPTYDRLLVEFDPLQTTH
ncbi:hypothetical protein HBB16_07585 [Pseudonocardia sp. MCCB 268]|nr:hypothetical protein [Pseudonocardia cytotoxica]